MKIRLLDRIKKIVNKYNEKVFKFGYDKRVNKSTAEDYIETVSYEY